MADELTLPSLSAANNPEIPSDVFGRIEAIEQLLQALNRELQSLKREISLNSPTASPESANTTILDQELPDLTNPVLPSRNWSSDKETIFSAAPVYELSISQIFLNKKRRNLKKGETIDRYSFERRN